MAARRVSGEVLQVQSAFDVVAPNFHQALVALRSWPAPVRVLCNAHYPIIAFARPAAREGDVNLNFVDCPELADVLRDEFTIITSSEAGAEATPELISGLSEAEVGQISYWRARRVGDVIFNYWD